MAPKRRSSAGDPGAKRARPEPSLLKREIVNCVEELCLLDEEKIFHPDPARQLDNYDSYVEEKMFFNRMKRKAKALQYLNFSSLRRDFNLMVENALNINEKDSHFYRAAEQLQFAGLQIIDRCEQRYHSFKKEGVLPPRTMPVPSPRKPLTEFAERVERVRVPTGVTPAPVAPAARLFFGSRRPTYRTLRVRNGKDELYRLNCVTSNFSLLSSLVDLEGAPGVSATLSSRRLQQLATLASAEESLQDFYAVAGKPAPPVPSSGALASCIRFERPHKSATQAEVTACVKGLRERGIEASRLTSLRRGMPDRPMGMPNVQGLYPPMSAVPSLYNARGGLNMAQMQMGLR